MNASGPVPSLAARLSGPLVLVSGLLLGPTPVGAALAHLEYISNPLYVAIVWAFQVVLILLGLALLFTGFARALPRALSLLVAAAAAAGILLGLYGTARHLEWIRPAVRDLPELSRWLTTGKAPYFGDWEGRDIEARIRKLDLTPPVRLDTLEKVQRLGERALGVGRVQDAVALLARALEAGQASGHSPEALVPLRFTLGLAHLRNGEVDHCIEAHRAESCLYPIQRTGVWGNIAPARAAAEQFREVLRAKPDHLGARWLLNIAYMVAGEPQAIPADLLIPPRRAASYREILPFRDLAGRLDLGSFNLAGGAILDDFDGDGRLDLVTSTYHPAAHMRYMHNDGRGGFEDWSQRSGIAAQLGGFNLYQTDYNNDGRLDVLVLRGAWMQAYGRQRLSLVRQNADQTFTDVTHEAGLGDTAYPSLAAGWADYDNDGDLDLFVGYEHLIPGKSVRSPLFRNEGNGTFREVAREAGIDARGNFKSVAWGDYDNDGHEDLYLSDLSGPNRLYHNHGDGTFSEVGRALGVHSQPPDDKTFASWFWDYDNDGWLDLFVGGYGAETLEPFVADYMGLPSPAERLTLYRNDGQGGFADVTRKVGLDRVQMPMGANYGDFDHDGWPDIYLGTGRPGFEFLVPNVLYHNVRGERFVDVTTAAGVGHLQKGHAVAFGDVDNDGDRDLFAQMGGFYPADRYASSLFENPGYGTHWIGIKLVGRQSNRAAVGARVQLQLDGPQGRRRVFSRVTSGGSFGASTLRLELGLDSADRIAELEVRWPKSGARQVFRDVPADRFIEITESAPDYRTLDLPAAALAPGTAR